MQVDVGSVRLQPDLRHAERSLRAVLDMLATHFTSSVFTAALELWVAARTDDALRAAVGPLEQRIGRDIHRRTVELLHVDHVTIKGSAGYGVSLREGGAFDKTSTDLTITGSALAPASAVRWP